MSRRRRNRKSPRPRRGRRQRWRGADDYEIVGEARGRRGGDGPSGGQPHSRRRHRGGEQEAADEVRRRDGRRLGDRRFLLHVPRHDIVVGSRY